MSEYGKYVVLVGVRRDLVVLSAATKRPVKRLSLAAQIVALRFARGTHDAKAEGVLLSVL